MLPSRPRRLRVLVLAALLASALLMGVGCDDREEVAPEDQRLLLTAVPPTTCPAIVEDTPGNYILDESAIQSRFELVATIFADDGQVQEGVEITIEGESGLSETGETDDAGQFRVDTPAPSLDLTGDTASWNAFAENGEESETLTRTGALPFMTLSTLGATSVGCGEEFEFLVSVGLGCLVNRVDATFRIEERNEDDEVVTGLVEFLGARKIGALEFDEDGDGTVDDNSTLVPLAEDTSPTPKPLFDQRFDVDYFRNDNWGLTADTGIYALIFRTLEGPDCGAGSLALFFEDDTMEGEVTVTPAEAIAGSGYVYDLLSPPDDADPRIGGGAAFTLTGETPVP